MRDVKEDIKNRYICINIYITEMELRIGGLVIDHDGKSPHARKVPKFFN